jgi:hypothetical protein
MVSVIVDPSVVETEHEHGIRQGPHFDEIRGGKGHIEQAKTEKAQDMKKSGR